MSRPDSALGEDGERPPSSTRWDTVPDPLSIAQRAHLESERGREAEDAGRYAEAEQHFVSSAELRIADASAHQADLGEYALREIADDFRNAAMNARCAGHIASSAKLYNAALESIRSAIAQAGTPRSAAGERILRRARQMGLSCLESLGELALDRARSATERERAVALGEAEDHYRALYDAAVADKATGYAGTALKGLAIGMALSGSGDPAPYLEQAADAFRANRSGPLEVEARWRLAAWAYQHDDTEKAFDECQRGLEVRQRSRDTRFDELYAACEARCADLLATLAADREDDESARQWLNEAATLFDRAGDQGNADAARDELSDLATEPDEGTAEVGIISEEEDL